ncbi:hypothetical protein FNH05_10910 [Amycolatopsis rhizosphaerae]|uniref:Uncharacterized protein n=1 Tax=Amycolatopsis rhizosphaerae TaxID=2053003 RepID=A0A558CZE0_9PSEU|nr:hypothetical protein [Amycolatopsis rhizosphaerae]TVT54098.1 hypothetical protein FNH05_10910 [Amycolatopsis rhizosphaerae]
MLQGLPGQRWFDQAVPHGRDQTTEEPDRTGDVHGHPADLDDQYLAEGVIALAEQHKTRSVVNLDRHHAAG